MGWFENIKYNLQGLDKLEIAKLQGKVTEINKLLENFEGSPGQVIELSGSFTELSNGFDGLSGKFDSLSGELSNGFNGLSESFTELSKKFDGLSSKFEGLPADLSDKFDNLSGSFTELSDKFDSLQEKFTGLEEKVETFADMVGGQEQAIIICTIATAVAVTAIASFVAFCIYQGVKLDKEKKNDLCQDKPNGKFSNVGDTEKLNNNLQQVRA
ncbi:hypothetical protein [Wolbachia endosymbiont (group B) of Gerris lacustris]|uniref:hypothetical protein n=1 Tax=Wolbachia endosymbiont (group B) of Gerris lacustris TaxID=3066159 RepID=UPI00333E2B02